jgi:hypothetical protein
MRHVVTTGLARRRGRQEPLIPSASHRHPIVIPSSFHRHQMASSYDATTSCPRCHDPSHHREPTRARRAHARAEPPRARRAHAHAEPTRMPSPCARRARARAGTRRADSIGAVSRRERSFVVCDVTHSRSRFAHTCFWTCGLVDLWRLVEACGGLWRLVEACGGFWTCGLVGASGRFWTCGLLDASGRFWTCGLVGASGRFWTCGLTEGTYVTVTARS